MKKFDFNTINNFDNHILQSIPNYDLLFNSIVRLSEYFITDNYKIYDIGCSTGKLLYKLQEQFSNIEMIGIDNSKNLLPDNCQTNLKFICADLNKKFVLEPASLIFSIFTLQFLHKETRQLLINNIYNSLCKGGAFIFSEKVYSKNSMTQDMFTFTYYDYKKTSFTEEEILTKEQDLRKILRPYSTEENIEMLHKAGFKTIELFYKYFNFEGYLCIK